MIAPIDLQPYAAVYVLDSQLALEARPLEQLPWDDLGAGGPVLLLILPQMLVEVDGKKRDGRLGGRARMFNRLIEPATLTAAPMRLVETPRVDLALAPIRRIDWSVLDDLDPAQGDDRLVAEMLSAIVSHPDRLCMFSYDTRPRASAIRHGLSALKPPEGWMLAPEPGPEDKELMRLRQRLQLLESTMPAPQLTLTGPDSSPIKCVKFAPMEEARAKALSAFMLAKNPQSRAPWGIELDHGYGDRYEEFRSAVEAFPGGLPAALEQVHNQHRVRIAVSNAGAVAADHLEIEIRARGARLLEKVVLTGVTQPEAPEHNANSFIMDHLTGLPLRGLNRRGRTDVDFDPEPERTDVMRLVCDDFRQGRDWSADIFVAIDPDGTSPVEITARLTARNLPGQIMEEITLPFTVEAVAIGDYFDFDSMSLKAPFPLLPYVQGLSTEELEERVELTVRD